MGKLPINSHKELNNSGFSVGFFPRVPTEFNIIFFWPNSFNIFQRFLQLGLFWWYAFLFNVAQNIFGFVSPRASKVARLRSPVDLQIAASRLCSSSSSDPFLRNPLEIPHLQYLGDGWLKRAKNVTSSYVIAFCTGLLTKWYIFFILTVYAQALSGPPHRFLTICKREPPFRKLLFIDESRPEICDSAACFKWGRLYSALCGRCRR